MRLTTNHDLRSGGGGERFGDFGEITNPEIVRGAGLDVMPISQQRGELAYGQWNVLRRTGGNINVIQVGKAGYLRRVDRLNSGLLRVELDLLVGVKLVERIDLAGGWSGGG